MRIGTGSFSIDHQIGGHNESGVWSLPANDQLGINFAVTQASTDIAAVPNHPPRCSWPVALP